jgi:hypothetical protein
MNQRLESAIAAMGSTPPSPERLAAIAEQAAARRCELLAERRQRALAGLAAAAMMGLTILLPVGVEAWGERAGVPWWSVVMLALGCVWTLAGSAWFGLAPLLRAGKEGAP